MARRGSARAVGAHVCGVRGVFLSRTRPRAASLAALRQFTFCRGKKRSRSLRACGREILLGCTGLCKKYWRKSAQVSGLFLFFGGPRLEKGNFAPRAAARTTVTCRLTAARVIRTQKRLRPLFSYLCLYIICMWWRIMAKAGVLCQAVTETAVCYKCVTDGAKALT